MFWRLLNGRMAARGMMVMGDSIGGLAEPWGAAGVFEVEGSVFGQGRGLELQQHYREMCTIPRLPEPRLAEYISEK